MRNKSFRNKMILLGALIFCSLMFFFGYALVPLYNVFCHWWGINGNQFPTSFPTSTKININRSISVEFLANVNDQLPVIFYPQIKKMTIHPGENIKLTYFLKNNSEKTITIQSVASVTPGMAATHIKKMTCFSFGKQILKPHQFIYLPVIFYVDNDLSKKINEFTLSYTVFLALKNKYKVD